MCRLKKCCVSFVLALLLSSVFLVPCFADVFATASTEYVLDLYIAGIDQDPLFVSLPVHVNGNGQSAIIEFRTNPVEGYPLKVYSNYYEPKDYDRTIFLSAGLMSGGSAWFNNVNDYADKPTVYWADSRDPGINFEGYYEYANGVDVGNDIFEFSGTHGELFNFKITVPAYSNSFRFDTSGFVTFSADDTWTISSYGAYIIDTTDVSIIEAVQKILQHTQSIDGNMATMVTSINLILEQMRELNADTDTIIEMLQTVSELNSSQLMQLENISSSVDAIYYFLTQAMKTESENLSQGAAVVAGGIKNNDKAEVYYQTSMQGSYDSLDLDNFTFGGITGGMELVGAIFSDMFAALGSYSILFTYPLILGIALLAIGRLSKSAGRSSSRSESKAGDSGG